ncbi:hypothetical protein DERP_004947 [Dermatophagoides pteronyssinus]|uniref:Uncharacterized protein n=1 Tax=Dermatophagoides pteronyssinus TaxID=6956 RepID=A0ABQ8JT19_DERPT|nr:hypothetical protein DERP_004947 [Dermatophagoides pteronyssinus]
MRSNILQACIQRVTHLQFTNILSIYKNREAEVKHWSVYNDDNRQKKYAQNMTNSNFGGFFLLATE